MSRPGFLNLDTTDIWGLIIHFKEAILCIVVSFYLSLFIWRERESVRVCGLRVEREGGNPEQALCCQHGAPSGP